VKLFALKLHRYLSTQRRKIFGGMKGVIWVNTRGPIYLSDPFLRWFPGSFSGSLCAFSSRWHT